MEKEVLDYVIEKTHELMNASSCCNEAKEAAQSWLNAIGTEDESIETEKYIAELEEDIGTIDGLIDFAGSEYGIKHFGVETAKSILEHAKEIKAQGAKYCDCATCQAVAAILEKKDDLLHLMKKD